MDEDEKRSDKLDVFYHQGNMNSVKSLNATAKYSAPLSNGWKFLNLLQRIKLYCILPINQLLNKASVQL